MRRRNNRHEAARSFYERHKHDELEERSVEDAEKYRRSQSSPPLPSRFVILLRAVLSVLLRLVSAARAIGETIVQFLAGCLRKDVDLADGCVACLRRFSLLRGVFRRKCANCLNDFCDACLDKRHETFDGRPGSAGSKRPVCAYCFFTLCARHCRARCCADLSARELKDFLRRKGVSSRTALEKSDLVDLIHNWSLDLDATARQEEGGCGEDLEAGGRDVRQQTSYSASSAHLLINEMGGMASNSVGSTYSHLSIRELRRQLISRGIDTTDCIERTDFVILLTESDRAR